MLKSEQSTVKYGEHGFLRYPNVTKFALLAPSSGAVAKLCSEETVKLERNLSLLTMVPDYHRLGKLRELNQNIARQFEELVKLQPSLKKLLPESPPDEIG